MADNVTLDAGSGGDTIAADDISSVKYPRSKITLGADGVNDGDVSSANPMPVTHGALTELAAAIDTEVQVDIVGSLPSGTNAIGKLAANSGVDIGDVDVTSLPTTVHSADYDTGAGTDTTLAFGIAVPAPGGAAVVPGDATAGLKVDLGTDNDVTVTGSVTANAGTNLNTSALALESGGNLAGAATSLAVVDDWDESDRAKVNLIAGQAGITAGAGTVGASTPRVTLASDDPAVTALQVLDNIVSGSEAQVDIVASLPAGTNNIGDVDILSIAAGDNNIGNVDVVTVPADPFGANADAAATAGSTGSIQAKLRLITSQLDSIKTAVETLDNAISGSEMQVDLVSAAVTNAGTFAVQVDGAALTALQLIDNPVLVDDAAFTPATSSVMMAGFQADEASTDSVNEGDAGAARMTLDRKVIVNLQPHTAGGVSTFKSNDIDETEEDVKTSAGQVYFIYCVNTNASARYLKVYNATAANVTVGSTATKMDLLIPPSNSGFFLQFPTGVAFDTAICVAATTGLGDSDTGAPGTNEVQVTVGYM